MTFRKGSEIFGEGESADYAYKLIKGSAHTYKILNDGRRQIQDFCFAGDTFGLERGEVHEYSAEAVTDTVVLVVRRSAILNAASRDNEVAAQIWAHTSNELNNARNHAALLVKSAHERVASFLLNLSARAKDNAIDLPMSRQDIADYLGLTIETVSRTLTQFQEEATIALPSLRRVVLRNRAVLKNFNS
jgi:CRP-like cAMP-binding protein